MCGIVGFAIREGEPEDFPENLCKMLSALKHRGPDEMGYYFDTHVGLGSARLSIIDLKTGTQPITDYSNQYIIIFNGEIFNYIELRKELEQKGEKFKTNTDTEVILIGYKIWGNKVCEKLNGQFAFCIYNKKHKKLFLGRDRYGERPLFYSINSKGIYFASEIKSLFTQSNIMRKFDNQGLGQAGQLWTVVPGKTVFENIKQIKHGHWVEYDIDNKVLNEHCYYKLSKQDNNDLSLEQNIEKLKSLLDYAVDIRLRSDVEVGTYLSGGIDSAIITHLVKTKLNKNVHSFSIRFEDKEFDEGIYQDDALERFETQHHSTLISNSDISNYFEDVVFFSETIQFRTAAVPMFLLSKMVNEIGLKVVLTGEGSDEWFLGYNIYKEIKLREKLSQDATKKSELKNLFPYISYYSDDNLDALLRFYNSFREEKTKGLFSHEPRFSNGIFARKMLLNKQIEPLEDLSLYLSGYADISAMDSIDKAQLLEVDTLLTGYLLSTQGDRMASAHSVEGRSAFLDHQLVQFAKSIPRNQLLHNNGTEKFILKEAYKSVLPESIIKRPKQPYRAPDLVPFIQNLPKNDLLERLNSVSIDKLELLDINFCNKFFNKIFMNKSEQYSQRESQAFLFLYSIIILAEKFIYNPIQTSNIDSLIKLRIDGRTWQYN